MHVLSLQSDLATPLRRSFKQKMLWRGPNDPGHQQAASFKNYPETRICATWLRASQRLLYGGCSGLLLDLCLCECQYRWATKTSLPNHNTHTHTHQVVLGRHLAKLPLEVKDPRDQIVTKKGRGQSIPSL